MAQANVAEERTQDALQGKDKISGAGLLARLFWLVGGNLALLGAAAVILRDDLAALSWMSLLFWLFAGALIGVRYLDVTRLGGLTSDGKPATLADFRRYGVKLLAFAAVLWLVVLVL